MRAPEKKGRGKWCVHAHIHIHIHALAARCKGLFAVLAGGEAERRGSGGWSQSSRVWDRGPRCLPRIESSHGAKWQNNQEARQEGSPGRDWGLHTQPSWEYLQESLNIPIVVAAAPHVSSGCAMTEKQAHFNVSGGRWKILNYVNPQCVDAGDVRFIFCDGIQLTSAEFSAGETLDNCRVMQSRVWMEKRK